jgi:hypothetical protein
MNSAVYRDKVSNSRLFIPLVPVVQIPDNDTVAGIEVWNWPDRDGVHMNCKMLRIPAGILRRHYKREDM